jgi:hypothetical protein
MNAQMLTRACAIISDVLVLHLRKLGDRKEEAPWPSTRLARYAVPDTRYDRTHRVCTRC